MPPTFRSAPSELASWPPRRSSTTGGHNSAHLDSNSSRLDGGELKRWRRTCCLPDWRGKINAQLSTKQAEMGDTNLCQVDSPAPVPRATAQLCLGPQARLKQRLSPAGRAAKLQMETGPKRQAREAVPEVEGRNERVGAHALQLSCGPSLIDTSAWQPPARSCLCPFGGRKEVSSERASQQARQTGKQEHHSK